MSQPGLKPRVSGVPYQHSNRWDIETWYIDWRSHTYKPSDILPLVIEFRSRILWVKEMLWNMLLGSDHGICTLGAKCKGWWKVKSQLRLKPRASGVLCQCSNHWATETRFIDWQSHLLIRWHKILEYNLKLKLTWNMLNLIFFFILEKVLQNL